MPINLGSIGDSKIGLSSATFSDIGGAVSDIFGGQAQSDALLSTAKGATLEAKNYGMAADLAGKNEQYTEESTALQTLQQERTNYQAYSGAQSDIAGAGFRESGSGLYILQDNARQGQLAISTLQKQGLITEEGYREQAASYQNLQQAALYQAAADRKAAEKAREGGILGGILKGAAAVATLFI